MDESVGMGVSLNMGISVFCLGFLDTCSEDRMRVCRIGIEKIGKGNCASCALMRVSNHEVIS